MFWFCYFLLGFLLGVLERLEDLDLLAPLLNSLIASLLPLALSSGRSLEPRVLSRFALLLLDAPLLINPCV